MADLNHIDPDIRAAVGTAGIPDPTSFAQRTALQDLLVALGPVDQVTSPVTDLAVELPLVDLENLSAFLNAVRIALIAHGIGKEPTG